MQLRIRTPDRALAPVTRRAVERRVRLDLGRHASEIASAQVTVSGGPPADHRVRLRVRLHRGDVLRVEDRAEGAYAAVASASWRMAHRLERDRHARGLAVRSRRLLLRRDPA